MINRSVNLYFHVSRRKTSEKSESVAGVIKGYLIATKYKTQIKDLKVKQESI